MRVVASRHANKMSAAIPYRTNVKDRGSLSLIINRVSTTVVPPRDVDSEAHNTPQSVVLNPVEKGTEGEIMKCWYAKNICRDKDRRLFGQARS